MTDPRPRDLDVIAPNLKRRLSGVTATVVRLIPVQAETIAIAATGPGLPPEVPHIPLASLIFLPRDRWRVWHARRNTEMLLGLLLRHVFRRKLRMLFTSASQRRHSRYTKWLISRMDAVIATSSKTASYLERPATVILHGIDISGFRPAGDKPGLRGRLGFLREARLVGCYGRIRAQKGTDLFVRAMISVLPDHPEWQAIVLGRATEKHRGFLAGLKTEVAAAGLADRIHFPPEVPVHQIADWYAALDLFVAPQRWEGFGLTPIEAMACGVPVIATDVGAFSEIVLPGETGAILPPGDLAAMETAVGEALSDDARLAGWASAGRARVETAFDIRREAAEIIAVYRDLLAQ